MMLVIREYLSMLKESEELDSLLNDLLLSMGLIPLDKPQIGARQYGADIRAVGKLDNDNTDTVYLFVVKQGDITRNLWNNDTAQSIRPSLDELKDVYLQLMIEKEYMDFPIKIVLCTNGEMNQTAQPNWNGYVKNQSTAKIHYEFWGGNKISDLINQHLLNEFLFPVEMQKKIRKSLAFINIDDYNYKDIYELIDELINNIDMENTKSVNKNIRLLNLITNMIHLWGCEDNNTQPGYSTVTRSIIKLWAKFEDSNLLDKNIKTKEAKLKDFNKLIKSQNKIYAAYLNNISLSCRTEHGFHLYSRNHVIYSNIVFEQISRIANIAYHFMNMSFNDKSIYNYDYTHALHLLKSIIKYNPSSDYPMTDDNIDSISMSLIVLCQSGNEDIAKAWIHNIVDKLTFNHKYNNKFPLLYSDDEKLIDIHFFNEEYTPNTSLMVYQLFMWMAFLDMKIEFSQFRNYISQNLPKLNLQNWYPDESHTKLYYNSPLAPFQSGIAVTNLTIKEDIQDHINLLKVQWKKFNLTSKFSFFEYSFPQLGFMITDHYKVPLLPKYHELFYNLHLSAKE